MESALTDADETQDHVDRLRAQWQCELPDLDTGAMAVLGRAYRLSNLVRPSIEATFASFGLDRGEFDIVSTLRRAGAPFRLTPTELYTSLMIASGSLSHRLARLERAGLVRRVPSDTDGRSLAVELTESGRAKVEAAFRADMASEATFLNHLSPEEREALAALLRKLNRAIEDNLETTQGHGWFPPAPKALLSPD